MKVAPLMRAMHFHPNDFEQILVHTGQHSDPMMSRVFLEDLNMPAPDEFLNVRSGSRTQQTADIMRAFERVLDKHKPDWVVVSGDVTSTLACGLTCAQAGVSLAHVEAGLRSNDRTMPEEVNRILVDHIADLLFVPCENSLQNLLKEGVAQEKVHMVGNIMIDSVVRALPRVGASTVLQRLGVSPNCFALVTLHRPSNVDHPEALAALLKALSRLSAHIPVVFPVHPRTRRHLGKESSFPGVRFTSPLGYIDFLALVSSANCVVTDSGGLQEETTFLGISCLTARENTERPITITHGTNRLIGCSANAVYDGVMELLASPHRKRQVPEYWDGQTASRIVNVFRNSL